MGASQKPKTWPLLLLLLCWGPGKPSAGRSAPQVDCIVFNEDYIICDWGSKQKPMASYSFYSWFYPGKPEECKYYLQTDGIPVGCWLNFTLTNDNLFADFHVSINSSHTNTSYSTSMDLKNRVKVAAPFNLSIEPLDNNQLQLHWNTTYKKRCCLEHTVKYRSNKDTSWTEQKTEEMKFNVVSVDPEKRYTFYVYSKLKHSCGDTDLCSEPGGPVYWGKETTPSMPLYLQVCLALASLFLLMVFVLILLHMERVRLVLMPTIPNPGKKFEDLFTTYHGNFSEWVGVSKDAMETFKPSYRESICHVSEFFPGGGYLPVSMDAGAKAAGVPGISVGSGPPANIV